MFEQNKIRSSKVDKVKLYVMKLIYMCFKVMLHLILLFCESFSSVFFSRNDAVNQEIYCPYFSNAIHTFF